MDVFERLKEKLGIMDEETVSDDDYEISLELTDDDIKKFLEE